MSRDKLGTVTVNAFRSGVTIGIGILIWLQTNTVFQKEYQSDKAAEVKVQALINEHLNTKFETIQNELRRINAKLDRLVLYDPPRHEPELKGRL